MQSDTALAQQAIELLHQKEQETMRLLELAQNQTERLLLLSQQQQALIAQHRCTIDRLEAELHSCRLRRQASFSVVHLN